MDPLDLRVREVRMAFQEYLEKLALQDQMGHPDHEVPLEKMVRVIIKSKKRNRMRRQEMERKGKKERMKDNIFVKETLNFVSIPKVVIDRYE